MKEMIYLNKYLIYYILYCMFKYIIRRNYFYKNRDEKVENDILSNNLTLLTKNIETLLSFKDNDIIYIPKHLRYLKDIGINSVIPINNFVGSYCDFAYEYLRKYNNNYYIEIQQVNIKNL